MEPTPRHRKTRIVLAVIAAAVVLLILLWDWNWFRPVVERLASSALGRQVILGHLAIELSRHPLIVLDDIAVANPEELPADTRMATVGRLMIRIDPWQSFKGSLRLMEIDIDAPHADLKPGPSGKPNYVFEKLQEQPPQGKKEPGKPLEILALNISDGDVHFADPELKADFRVRFRTRPAAEGGEPKLTAEVEGTYSGQPITGKLIAGSLLSLREATKPYPIDLRLANGATEVVLVGTVDQPLSFGGANLGLDFKGANLADLFPLTGVPLPPTAPFHVAGKLDYHEPDIRFEDFAGTVGQSDLAGDVAVNPSTPERRKITMKLRSKRVMLADLAGFLGATPGEEDAPNDSPEQQTQREQQKKSGKLLPDTPISLPRIRAADLDVRYQAKRIESDAVPIDDLDAHLIVEGGLLSLSPLNFGVGGGNIVSNIRLDAQQDLVHVKADADVRQLDLNRIMTKSTAFAGTGKIGGAARIDARGNSLAQMLGRGDGELKLFMSGGDLSALLVNLMGLDFGNSLVSALGLPSRATLRCMVSDFDLEDGLLDTQMLLVDTTEANVIGDGTVNFGNEALDYELRTEPKRPNVASVAAPIHIRGTLNDPAIRPDIAVLGTRGVTMIGLGTLLTPLAALIPTIQLGLGEDNDCDALMEQARQAPQSKP